MMSQSDKELLEPAAQSVRADFEAWFRENHHSRLDRKCANRTYNCPAAFAAWNTWEACAKLYAAPQPDKVPKGYRLGPIEPTEEMIQAGCLSQQRAPEYDNYDDWFNSHSGGISERIRNYLRKDYAAMLSAAPLPLKE